jgi:biopolymer transport protein ExbD
VNLRDEEGAEEPALNLTPMIDVVFQLLIFFMVATTFLDPEREMDVELPEAASGDPVEEQLDEIVINVLRDGGLVLSGEAVEEQQLYTTLARAAERNPDTPVTIRGDRLVHHESIVGVMDACGAAGLYNLAIGTMETP